MAGLVRLGGDEVSLGEGVTVVFTEFALEEFATSPCERSSGSVENATFRVRDGEDAHEWVVRVDTGLDDTYTVAGLTLRVVDSDFSLACDPWIVLELADEADE